MQHKRKTFLPIVLVFLIVTMCCLIFPQLLHSWNIDTKVVIGANILMFFISVYNGFQHLKAMQQTNSHAMVRGVMGSTVLKLFVLGTAAFVYLYNAGENKNVNGLFIGMGLYIVYTWLDVRIALTVNPEKKNGSN